DALHGHRAHQDVGAVALERAVWEMLARDATEVRKSDLRRFRTRAVAFLHRQLELHVVALACLLRFEIPLPLIGPAVGAPAEADRAVGQHDLAAFVEGDGLPL